MIIMTKPPDEDLGDFAWLCLVGYLHLNIQFDAQENFE